MGLVHVEMAGRDRQIHRLHHHAALPVQAAELLGDFQNVAKRRNIAIAPPPVAVGNMRRAIDRAEIDDIAANMQVARRVARVKHEFFRRKAAEMLHDIAPHPHDLRIVIDQRTMLFINGKGSRRADFHADFLKHAICGLEHAGDLGWRENVEGRPGVVEAREMGGGSGFGGARARAAGGGTVGHWREAFGGYAVSNMPAIAAQPSAICTAAPRE